jgi:hypothetical protein
MRQTSATSYGPEFITTVTNITSIVDSVVSHSQRTMTTSVQFAESAEGIVEMLRKANVGLDELGREMVKAGPGSKTLKQKLASASYEYDLNILYPLYKFI